MKIELKVGECIEPFIKQYDYFELVNCCGNSCSGINTYTIKGVIKPKKQAIKDLGKAVNWFCDNNGFLSYEHGTWFRNNRTNIEVTYEGIFDIVKGNIKPPDWWPDELTE